MTFVQAGACYFSLWIALTMFVCTAGKKRMEERGLDAGDAFFAIGVVVWSIFLMIGLPLLAFHVIRFY
jgi:hypothetical protein